MRTFLSRSLHSHWILAICAGFLFLTHADQAFASVGCPLGRSSDKCNSPRGSCGMATYALSEYLPGVLLNDQPLTYRPAFGPALDFNLNYRQAQLDNYDSHPTNSPHLGPRWSHSFLSFIRAEDTSPLGPLVDLRWVTSEGTFFTFQNTGSSYTSEFASMPTASALTGPTGYRLTFPDGAIMDFLQPNQASDATRYYLTKVTDAQGLSLTLSYDEDYRLDHITDATNNVTSFGYEILGGGFTTLIRTITDPFSRLVTLTYNSAGMLETITDPLGITSSFTYSEFDPDRVTSLTTPYGTTTFEYEGSPNSSYWAGWSVIATDPEGQVEKMETVFDDGFLTVLNNMPRPPSTISVNGTNVDFLTTSTVEDEQHYHVSFHWTKKYWGEYQKALLANPDPPADPYAFAHVTYWLMDPDIDSTSTPAASKEPGQAVVWYNYPGQTEGWMTGTDNRPTKSARQVEDSSGSATWVLTQQTYNAKSMPLVTTDELGRKVQRTYAANDQDLLTEDLWDGSAWVTVRTYAGYANHLPATITDELSGKITTFARNAKGQIKEVQISNGAHSESIRYTYDTAASEDVPNWPGNPGYLHKIEALDPANPTANPAIWVPTHTLTYDSKERVHTHTDASGYTRTFDYDDLDRPTLITYPDSTTEEFSYLRGLGAVQVAALDLTAHKDRAGRWTRTAYNSNRQPVLEIAPDGKFTQMDWCKCGSLWKLTDSLKRVTEWKRDILGRVTEKIMPDGVTKTTYTYEPASGRLATMKRPNDQEGSNPTVTYHYNLDGSLHQEAYTDSATPDVTYYYTAPVTAVPATVPPSTMPGTVLDPLGRLTFVDDGIGRHALTYNALTSSTSGAGQLSQYDGPLADDSFTYTYDWQDRAYLQTLQPDASTPVVSRSATLTWDSLGRPITVVNDLGTFTFGYTTNLSRPDTLTGPNNLVTSYAYFANTATNALAQQLQSITHSRTSGGVTTTYSSHTYDYDIAGRMISWLKTASTLTGTAPDSTNTFGYNLSDEVTGYGSKNTSTSAALDAQTWAYDNGGNWLSSGNTTDMSARTHDIMNRLQQIGGTGKTVVEGNVNEFATINVTSGSNPPVAASLVTDPAASGYRFRAEVPVQTGVNNLTVTAKDRDTPTANTTTSNFTFTAAAATRTFDYDANGNMLADKTGGTSTRTFTWDAKSRLKSVLVASTNTTYSWDYDYRDRRVKEYEKVGAGTATLTKVFVWQGNELVQERNASNVITRTHHFGGFADGSTGATKYQTTTDHLGSVREIIVASGTTPAIGTVVTRYDYSTFQGPLAPVKLTGTNVDASLQTIGKYYHHAGSGLELALYRGYDAGLGRWISEDPLGEEGGLNLYGYVGNDPLGGLDRLGLQLLVVGVPTMGGIAQHAFVFSTKANSGKGMAGCSSTASFGDGIGYNKDGSPNLKNATPVVLSGTGLTEEQALQKLKKYPKWNHGIWFPWANDCHGQLKSAFKWAGIPWPKEGVPGGRIPTHK